MNKWQCLCIPPPLVGEEQQAAGSSDRADQLQNNNFSAAGGAKLLGLDPPTCPVVCCCCWTQSGSHRLLLQGQTRLQWLQPKIGLGRRPLRAPKMLPLFVCLFVLFYLVFSFYLHSLAHCCKIQQRCSKKLSSLNLEFAKLFNWRGQSPGEGVNLRLVRKSGKFWSSAAV